MGFKFNDRTCVIEIEDVKYRVVFQKVLVDRLNGAKDVFSRMKKEGCTDNDKAVAAFDNAIDGILGEGSAEKIFAGRFPNIAERYAVLKYVYDEITEFILYVPVLILVCCNVIDYATGLVAAKYREESVNSYKSIKGIAKKICMWLLVAVGAMLDWLLSYAADTVGISIGLNFVVASVAAVWLIANEIISILENIKDIGAPLPPFLMRLAENVKSQAEKRADTGTSGKEEEY